MSSLEIDKIKVKELEAESIIVKSVDEKHSVSVVSFKDGVGAWVGVGANSFCILDSATHGKYVGINASGVYDKACPLALSIGDKDITLQVLKNGEVYQVSLLELFNKL
jgi:hypothetical protein